jgi:hypothetical protein
MILYHGTSMIIMEIDLSKSRKRTDFGKGFYLGDDLSWAGKWAETTVKRAGGIEIVMKYELSDTAFENRILNFCRFDTPNAEWLNFVRDNRVRLTEKTKEPRHSYDMVYGRIANDRAADVVKDYAGGTVSVDEAIKRIDFLPRVSQLSLHTPLALSYLKVVGYSQLDDKKWSEFKEI